MGMKRQGARCDESWFCGRTAEDELRKREEILPEIKKVLYPGTNKAEHIKSHVHKGG